MRLLDLRGLDKWNNWPRGASRRPWRPGVAVGIKCVPLVIDQTITGVLPFAQTPGQEMSPSRCLTPIHDSRAGNSEIA
ncbi:hypothetical protein BaRGS_00014767 [Batillaria attramentaria]|uniref:Uncharacterized protein n=1 Tax=Batillaria attramentaria TaxID=370345 RepID=A0ABD0L432_9CAEN